MNTQTTKWFLIGSAAFSVTAFVLALVALASGCEGGRRFEGRDGFRGMMNFQSSQGGQIRSENGDNGGNGRQGMMRRFDGGKNTPILSGTLNSGTVQ